VPSCWKPSVVAVVQPSFIVLTLGLCIVWFIDVTLLYGACLQLCSYYLGLQFTAVHICWYYLLLSGCLFDSSIWNSLSQNTKLEKPALDRGQSDCISLAHNLDLWPSIPCELWHLLTCWRSTVSRFRRYEWKVWTDGQTEAIALLPLLMRSVIIFCLKSTFFSSNALLIHLSV